MPTTTDTPNRISKTMILHSKFLTAVAVSTFIGAIGRSSAHPCATSDIDSGPCPYANSAGIARSLRTRGHKVKKTTEEDVTGLFARSNSKSSKGQNQGQGDDPIELTQDNFDNGTYRILESGTYKLAEDINFCPQPSNDYWPTVEQWDDYPPAAFYLGFFAAITIESDDVTIDLNKHTIRQCEQHYLLQRFFNVIQLNNRVFVPNEGVSSLNYQETDVAAPSLNSDTAGGLITPQNILIKNGGVGRSSHAGIHGNSIVGLTIQDVTVSDFEVAGIQCNGCKDVTIEDVTVGPSARDVPVLATFSNARFMEFYTQTLIPRGFEEEPAHLQNDLDALFQETIAFADRPGSPMTLQEIFDRLKTAVSLFRAYKNGDTSLLSTEDEVLLEEAIAVFTNPTSTPDGSVLYGIFLNRRGVPAQDDNFNGAGAETMNVVVRNTQITGLHSSPVEVPSLMTEEGSHMQGPSRDLLRILDVTSDNMRTILNSQYKGNILSDSYFALWQLSGGFYRLRVFDSDCGNFGSNATFPYNLKTFPSYEEPTCAEEGSSSDPSLSGRDIALLQRQYFGGTQISQGVYDWATTPGMGLDSILASPPSADALRNGGRHKIVCDHDTMFHPMHGSIGLKIVEAKGVDIKKVTISDILNTADEQIWVCEANWQLQPSEENIQSYTSAPDSSGAARVSGVEIVRSEAIVLDLVTIESLKSEEGGVVGIVISGDANDRTDHDDDTGISFENVVVQNLSGPSGVMSVKSSATTLATPSGITAGKPEETDTSLNNPRVIINYGLTNARSPRDPNVDIAPKVVFNEQVLLDIKAATSLDTDDKIKDYRKKVLAHYKQHFGMRFNESYVYDNADFLEAIVVYDKDGVATDSVIRLAEVSPDNGLHATSICTSSGDGSVGECTDSPVAMVHNHAFIFLPGPSGYTLHGLFGGDEGKFCPSLNIILVGRYTVEGFNIPGLNEDGANIEFEYFGECPTSFSKLAGDSVSWYIQCAVESTLFGKGVAAGAATFIPTDDGTEWKLNAGLSMLFDERVLFPQSSTASSNLLESRVSGTQANEWQFSVIADGKFSTLLGGIEALPYGHFYHYTHEAAISTFKTRTTKTTDKKIKALRTQFLKRLKDTFGIDIKHNDYDNIPLAGEIDLGGRGKIVSYVVNENANQRTMTKRGSSITSSMPPASRLHEVGFRLVVGRAGISTNDGTLPFGSMILEGLYILEDSIAGDLEIEFHSIGPIQLNGWSTAVVYNHLFNDALGEGRFSAMVPLASVSKDGIRVKVRGVLVFGNLDLDD